MTTVIPDSGKSYVKHKSGGLVRLWYWSWKSLLVTVLVSVGIALEPTGLST